MRSISNIFEILIPKSLITRFTLIICVPMVACQFFAVYLFYERHWHNVSTQTSNMIVSQLGLVVEGYVQGDLTNVVKYSRIFNFESKIIPYVPEISRAKDRSEILILDEILQEKIQGYITLLLDKQRSKINIFIKLSDDKIVNITLPSKPLINPTSEIFVLWIIGISVLFLLVALLFAKNQIRFIEELSDAANNFGKNKDGGEINFKPKGATEIRQAGIALIKMQERIEKHVQKRLQLLAMISHDLRTPLTRMLLQLELGDDNYENKMLKQDAMSMKHMIDSYLDFARGEEAEKGEIIELTTWVKEFFDHSKFGNTKLIEYHGEAYALIKPLSFMRALSNIISNAEKYSTYSELTLEVTNSEVSFILEDNGPGIKEEERGLVFKAFYRSDKARRIDKYGSVGLGLSIAKEIILGNNGTISILGGKKLGGAKITITIPRYRYGK